MNRYALLVAVSLAAAPARADTIFEVIGGQVSYQRMQTNNYATNGMVCLNAYKRRLSGAEFHEQVAASFGPQGSALTDGYRARAAALIARIDAAVAELHAARAITDDAAALTRVRALREGSAEQVRQDAFLTLALPVIASDPSHAGRARALLAMGVIAGSADYAEARRLASDAVREERRSR
ncbi:MAG: hypothetical protein SF051_00120 [Elusimicrobiota bacterium]|nr:hypothetical protein [Elusimicrobiota bacterium]